MKFQPKSFKDIIFEASKNLEILHMCLSVCLSVCMSTQMYGIRITNISIPLKPYIKGFAGVYNSYIRVDN